MTGLHPDILSRCKQEVCAVLNKADSAGSFSKEVEFKHDGGWCVCELEYEAITTREYNGDSAPETMTMRIAVDILSITYISRLETEYEASAKQIMDMESELNKLYK